jgi:hypothetical protein
MKAHVQIKNAPDGEPWWTEEGKFREEANGDVVFKSPNVTMVYTGEEAASLRAKMRAAKSAP